MVEFAATGTKIYFNGKIVPEREATVHVLSGAVKYGATVFEGICAYLGQQNRLNIFRLPEHLQRLQDSMQIMRFEHDWSDQYLAKIVSDVLQANDLHEDAHIRLSAYILNEGFLDATQPVALGCLAVRRHDTSLADKAARAQVSSWHRIEDASMPPRIKCAANYQNGRLATIQARTDGYNEAILLTRSGKVAESAGACLMAIRDGIVITPTVTDSILESVTRATLIELFERELGMEVKQREIDRTELYLCQEVFLCGSGYEVMPIVDIDGYRIGDGTVGKNTQAIFDAYDTVTRGGNERYDHWLTSV